MTDFAETSRFPLEPERVNADGTVIYAGNEVFIRGIGGRILGVGVFAGDLVLEEASGNKVAYPILEVQGRIISGGQVDLWSARPDLVAEHRDSVVYPIDKYLAELRAKDEEFTRIWDKAIATAMGIRFE